MNVETDFQFFLTRVVVDVACLLAVSIPILIFYLAGKPYERGFFCDDESLRHPYLESTVPSWVLYVVGLGLPIVVILATECLVYARNSNGRQKKIMSVKVPGWMWESYRHIGVFGFGAACSQLITDIAKYSIGRLRPHFFDVCRPDIDCSNPKYRFSYIEKFTCVEKNEKLLKDMRLSFPSGHSSFSAYCMLYLVPWSSSVVFERLKTTEDDHDAKMVETFGEGKSIFSYFDKNGTRRNSQNKNSTNKTNECHENLKSTIREFPHTFAIISKRTPFVFTEKMYLHVRMTWRGSKLLKHLLQYFCLIMAFYTALTRISDYKHHWSDVLAGSVQGIIVAVLIVVYVSDLLENSDRTRGGESPSVDGIRMDNDLSMR